MPRNPYQVTRQPMQTRGGLYGQSSMAPPELVENPVPAKPYNKAVPQEPMGYNPMNQVQMKARRPRLI